MKKLKDFLIGSPKDLKDPGLFHKISLIPFLAWVGLGADGLSSSAYGPDEAFRALAGHKELAVVLALASAFTVFIISLAYSKIIEHFPQGGGGYLVSTKLLGEKWGLVSGAALLVDYVLTITVSIASGGAQVFSFLPKDLHYLMVPAEAFVIIILIIMNIRGAKESISILVPIFLLFLATHITVVISAFYQHYDRIPQIANEVQTGLSGGLSSLGFVGMFLIFARAYSRGAGTYTGIEAVSNGIQIMREPRVKTAKKTMVYMAVSLSITVASIFLVYLMLDVNVVAGKTLNAVMLERLNMGDWFVILTLVSEAALLFVAAQAGFIDGPRVMSNMAIDSWLPHRFASLSERLTMQNGIMIMGAASLIVLFYAKGEIDTLVTMYSINVFITFSLSQFGMIKLCIQERKTMKNWKRNLLIQFLGFSLSFTILVIVIIEKIEEGAWITVLITSAIIGMCILIKNHYKKILEYLKRLTTEVSDLFVLGDVEADTKALDKTKPVAVLLVSNFNGLGIHSLVTIFRQFQNYYSQIVFLSVAVIDSGSFKGSEELTNLEISTQANLDKYKNLAHQFGVNAETRMAIGTESLNEAVKLCRQVGKDYPKVTFFAGKLVFENEKWYHSILHNGTAHAIQKQLQIDGYPVVVLPIRIFENNLKNVNS